MAKTVKEQGEQDGSTADVRAALLLIEEEKPGFLVALFNHSFKRSDGGSFQPDDLIERFIDASAQAAAHSATGSKAYDGFMTRYRFALSDVQVFMESQPCQP